MIHHNELCDLTASLLSEVCSDIGIEPSLQPFAREPLQYATANWKDGARLDVVAWNVWSRNWQCAFLTLECLTHFHPPILALHCLNDVVNEQEKCCAYDECIREVERGCFFR